MIDAERRELAQRKTDAFRRRVQAAAASLGEREPGALADSALDLASHAAVAVALDARLLNLIRVNFFVYRQPLPYWTESPLLLSSLCRHEGDGLFVMDEAVRDLLLMRLASEHGPGRVRQLASLLWQYAEREPSWADRKELRHAQQITALNFIDPERANTWLQEAQTGAGENTLSKEWFVAIQAGLPALPQIANEGGDAQTVCDALMELGFEEQTQALVHAVFREPGPKMLFIAGPPDTARLWLLYRLIRHSRVDVRTVFELPWTRQMNVELEAFSRALAATMGVPLDRNWVPAIDRLVEVGARGSALAITGSERADEGRLFPLLSDVAGMIYGRLRDRKDGSNVWLFIVGERPPDRVMVGEGPMRFLPPIGRFSVADLSEWIDSHRTLLKVPVDTSYASALFAATGGAPEEVLQRLSIACGVRWKDVLARARAPFIATAARTDPISELAREYDDLRDRMPSGFERTRRMGEIVRRMRSEMRELPSLALAPLQNSDSAGMRLAAVVSLQIRPRADEVPWLGDRVVAPAVEKPFVEYHAILALQQAALRLRAAETGAVQETAEQLSEIVKPNTDRAAGVATTVWALTERRRGLEVLPALELKEVVVLPGNYALANLTDAEQIEIARRAADRGGIIFAAFVPLAESQPRIGVTCQVLSLDVLPTGVQARFRGISRYRVAPFRVLGVSHELAVAPHPDKALPAAQSLQKLVVTMANSPAFAQLLASIAPAYTPGFDTKFPKHTTEVEPTVASLCYALATGLGAPPASAYALLEADSEKRRLLLGLIQQALIAVGAGTLTATQRRELHDALRDTKLKELVSYLPKFADPPRQRAATPKKAQPKGPSIRTKLWPAGSRVKTAISGGTPRQQAAVREAANEWTKHANLRFDFVPPAEREQADIRVTLSDDAESWSYLGTAALGIADSEPTMTIGTAGGATPEAVRATALREFGHALGLINEHQNPNARIRWNRDAILKEMKDQGWDEATVDSQFFQRDPLRDYRPFDPSSIMMYNFPASWTLDGKDSPRARR